MKIAVYAICKDEPIVHINRFMTSAKGADIVVLADTGSSPTSLKDLDSAKYYGVQTNIHHISINPWRFDTARNVALALVPADVDVCVRLDLDEVLEPGWRQAIEEAWAGPVTQLWYDFTHSPGYTVRANNIHARHGYIWRGWDHEGLYAATGCPSVLGQSKVSITHHQDHSKPRTSIRARLELAVQEDKSSRTRYYLGREYFYYNFSERCIATLMDYLKLPDATWAAERMDAMSMIAESYFRMSQIGQGISWYYKAIAECTTREPYLGLARHLYRLNNKEQALGLAQAAIRLTNKLTNIYHKPSAWDKTPYVFIARCARDLGLESLAQKYDALGESLFPTINLAKQAA